MRLPVRVLERGASGLHGLEQLRHRVIVLFAVQQGFVARRVVRARAQAFAQRRVRDRAVVRYLEHSERGKRSHDAAQWCLASPGLGRELREGEGAPGEVIREAQSRCDVQHLARRKAAHQDSQTATRVHIAGC